MGWCRGCRVIVVIRDVYGLNPEGNIKKRLKKCLYFVCKLDMVSHICLL